MDMEERYVEERLKILLYNTIVMYADETAEYDEDWKERLLDGIGTTEEELKKYGIRLGGRNKMTEQTSVKSTYYCVANDKGEVIAHDIDSLSKAEMLCAEMNEQEPDAGWEVLEQ